MSNQDQQGLPLGLWLTIIAACVLLMLMFLEGIGVPVISTPIELLIGGLPS